MKVCVSMSWVRSSGSRTLKPQLRARRARRRLRRSTAIHSTSTTNNRANRVAEALRRYFPADRVRHAGPAPASEDFGCFGTAWNVPSVYWFVGSTDPEVYAKAQAEGRINDLPVNHSPFFAPVIHPTLQAGVEAMIVGALAWLAK